MIDLHLHTTASDGGLSPEALVHEAAAAGLTVLAVTDHDTMAATPAVASAAAAAGVKAVPGIEITAVHEGRDVHVLGYFLDARHPELSQFLSNQRGDRRRRLIEMAARLEKLGASVDVAALLSEADRQRGRAVGRPMLASALVAAGHAVDMSDAFDRYLSKGRPAFIERVGSAPADVFALIARAGGLASLAHPLKMGLDAFIGAFAASGLSALEAYHPDHSDLETRRYRQIARTHDLLVTGGSDYHGPQNPGRLAGFGRIGLPSDDFARLVERAGWTA